MSFTNATPFPAIAVPFLDQEGHEVVVAIAKATFEVDLEGHAHRLEDASPVRVADVPRDEKDPNTSLLFPSDVCPAKHGCDVVVIGDAVARNTVATFVDVGIKVGEVTTAIRVHGERLFQKGLTGVVVGPAASFVRRAITYERAYGGTTPDFSVSEARNPSGVGVAKRDADLVDRPAPCVEHPAYAHKSPRDRHPPIGCGAIMSHWSPRRDYVGTCDAEWQYHRMPLMPKDFDLRYYNVAHPALVRDEPLIEGAEIAVLGMTEDVFRCPAPKMPVVFRGVFDVSGKIAKPAVVDTLLIETSRRRIELTARAVFRVGRGRDTLREVRIDLA